MSRREKRCAVIVWAEYPADETIVHLIEVALELLDDTVALVELADGSIIATAADATVYDDTETVDEWMGERLIFSMLFTAYNADENMAKVLQFSARLREQIANHLAKIIIKHSYHESWEIEVQAAIAKLRRCPKCDGTGSAYTDSRGNYWPCPNGCKP